MEIEEVLGEMGFATSDAAIPVDGLEDVVREAHKEVPMIGDAVGVCKLGAVVACPIRDVVTTVVMGTSGDAAIGGATGRIKPVDGRWVREGIM